MTVISILIDRKIAISDLLISTEEPGDYASIPTLGDTSLVKDSLDFSIVGLMRKIFYLQSGNQKASILWAGSVNHVRRFRKKLNNLVESKSDNFITLIDSVINEQEESGYGDFEIIALVNDQIYCRSWSSLSDDMPYFGRLFSAGSGASDLNNWLIQRSLGFEKFCRDSSSVMKHRIMHNIHSMLLEEDIRSTLATISNGVGGYYESFFVDCTGLLRPIDNLLTSFVKIKSDHVEIRRFFFHYYDDCELVVIVISELPLKLKYGEYVYLQIEDFDKYSIPSLDYCSEKNEDNLMSSDELINRFINAESFSLTIYPKEDDALLKRFFLCNDSDVLFPVEFKVDNGKIGLKANENAMDYFSARFEDTLHETIGIR